VSKTFTLARPWLVAFGGFTALLLFAGVTSAQNLPKFSGLFFGDYYYVLQHDPANPINPTSNLGSAGVLQKDFQAFSYRRIYLTTDYDFAQDFSARFRLESDPSASSLGSNNNSGKLSVMIKDAFIKWNNVTDGGNIIIGVQNTPNINMVEAIFGYRPLEKTIQDLHGVSTSRDLGISYNQKFSEQLIAGLFVANNSSNNVPSNRYKVAYLYLQLNPVKEITILVDGQYNGAGVDLFNRTADVAINYGNSAFSLGAQYFLNGINVAGGSTLKRNGLSLNGWVGLIENLRLVTRYDIYTPNSDTKNTSAATSTQNLLIGALDWSVRKNVHLMPNIELVSYGWSGIKNNDILARATFYITF